ncbi:carboxypeptidase-like regulatory domain-containing protein [Rhizobacter sp. Root404]|uniref:carboxypeptidase-like regulatory domain-containing protein n=1 Tax=Rhizobacter sp. Root404 TaxID=1736528 RepID=UPI000A8D1000|nr:carboxypeptidase-like regulatory domain-containing protein [Rhizobacter sp. Root404]
MKNFSRSISCLEAFLALALLCSMKSAHADFVFKVEPLAGRVVDSTSGQPIEGVSVLADWALVNQTLDGSRSAGHLHIQEAVTDANGAFSFPGFTKVGPVFKDLGSGDPYIYLYKPGYVAAFKGGSLNPKSRTWPRKSILDGRTFRLASLTQTSTTDESWVLDSIVIRLDDVLRSCAWAQTPNFFRVMVEDAYRLRERYPNASISSEYFKLESATPENCKLPAPAGHSAKPQAKAEKRSSTSRPLSKDSSD